MGKQIFNLKGMMRDIDPAKAPNQFAYEIRNLRLTAQEDSTMLALVSEKGNTQYTITGDTINGDIVGYCTLGDYLVLFTHYVTQVTPVDPPVDNESEGSEDDSESRDNMSSNSTDYIYRLNITSSLTMFSKELYSKDLGFGDAGVKIETLGVYENETIQKVYWIDGVHQPRVINIAADNATIASWASASMCPFDFSLKMTLNESVSITKNYDYGLFYPGTIQYALSYRTKIGHTTPAFYVSALYYISNIDRGNSEDEYVINSFTLNISNVDHNFDYIDVYSVHRTSENGEARCKRVGTIKMSSSQSSYSFMDTGTTGEAVDYSEVLYLGGANIIPYTMDQKDNTLFFGGIESRDIRVTEEEMNTIANGCTGITFVTSSNSISKGTTGDYYLYNNELQYGANEITTFKYKESFAFGIIVQNEYGQWSNVIPLGKTRATNNTHISETDTAFNPVNVRISFNSTARAALSKYKRVKIVRMVEDPSILCQGIICPTLYNKKRKSKEIYSFSSWFFRGIPGNSSGNTNVQSGHNKVIKNFDRYYTNSTTTDSQGEICGGPVTDVDYQTWASKNFNPDDTAVFIDWNTLTVHSPDITFGDKKFASNKLQVIGYVPITGGITSMFADLDNPTHSGMYGLEYSPSIYNNVTSSVFLDLADDVYKDTAITFGNNVNSWNTGSYMTYPVFPWHRTSSLSGKTFDSGDFKYGELKSKCMATLRCSTKNLYTQSEYPIYNTTALKIYEDDSNLILLENDPNDLDFVWDKIYSGELEEAFTCSGYTLNGVQGNNMQVVGVAEDPISIKYKSTRHGVCTLKYDSSTHYQTVPYRVNSVGGVFCYPFWSTRVPGSITNPFSTSYNYVIKSRMIFPTKNDFAWGNNMNILYITKSFAKQFGELAVGDYTRVLCYDPIPGASPFGTGSMSNVYNKIWKRVTNDNGVPSLPDSKYYKLEMCLKSSYGSAKFFEESAVDYSIYQLQDGNTTTIIEYADKLSQHAVSGVSNLGGDSGDINSYADYMYLVNIIGSSKAAITSFEGSSWVVAGLAESISSLTNNGYITGTIGDAYYQRFDCLKTYPYTSEDRNQIVEILSFMCETRVNIDGRYDINRGRSDNTYMTSTNFNLLNSSYSQVDNFFAPQYIDMELFTTNLFPNQIMWTRTKVYGSKIDSWTHIVTSSTLDMDGNLGRIRALRLWNDNLMCFQDMGIAQIMYNDKTIISTQQGVPIEIANSGKVDGKHYISNKIGCSNRDSIRATQDGIYFIDSNTREIYKWSNSLESLSKGKGFNSYMYDSNVNLSTEKTFYDPKLKDVYFRIEKTGGIVEYLVYNEQIKEFTSFFDYDMDFLIPFKDALISVEHNSNHLWKQFASASYLRYFGELSNGTAVYKDYSIQLISAENPTTDKTFTGVEFRADVLSGSITAYSVQSTTGGNYASINKLPFKTIQAWNEYQNTGAVSFERMLRKGVNLSQKFRIWRGDIGRDVVDTSHPLNRIRSPWARIKLTGGGANMKTVIHDIAVSYV